MSSSPSDRIRKVLEEVERLPSQPSWEPAYEHDPDWQARTLLPRLAKALERALETLEWIGELQPGEPVPEDARVAQAAVADILEGK